MPPETYIMRGIAIINPYGGIWTNEIFNTPDEAADYLNAYLKNTSRVDLGKFRLAMATQTVTLDRAPGEPTFIDMPSA